MTNTARDREIADLWDAVEALIEAITNGELEMRALEMVLAANHGLSMDALREGADFLIAQEAARQESADSASLDAGSRLARFRGRGRVH